jgi:hypothetical protein
MKKFMILFLVLGLVTFGCVQQPATEYVCSDGSVVSNPSLCPKEQTHPEQPIEDETLVEDTTFVLEGGQVYYYGGDHTTEEQMATMHYVVNSNRPVEVYVVPSKSDYNLIIAGGDFVHYPSCQGINVLKYDDTCTITLQGGLVIYNEGYEDATVSLQVYFVE